MLMKAIGNKYSQSVALPRSIVAGNPPATLPSDGKTKAYITKVICRRRPNWRTAIRKEAAVAVIRGSDRCHARHLSSRDGDGTRREGHTPRPNHTAPSTVVRKVTA